MDLRSRLLSSILAALAGPLMAAPSFVSAQTCALCHSRGGILTRAPVRHHETWRSSMMSFAARDPYWSARVGIESAAAAGKGSAEVQDKCLRCHAAADQYEFRSANKKMLVDDLTGMGREGVTCTVCHRIDPSTLGKSQSFTGGFLISSDAVIFGPHERPFAMPMLHHTGYEPVAAKHVRDAALCGACHTLLLKDATGRVTLPEQTTYLEWLASAYPSRNTTCQTCHVPAASVNGKPVSDYIAQRPPGGAFPLTRPRSPIGLHTFVGGNVQMLRHLGFDERAEATRRFLSSAVALEATAELAGRALDVTVTVRNLTGHKLPTGLPGRRLWLHLTAVDSKNRIAFESGAWNPETGELRYGRDFESHRDSIERPDQTAIYEAVIEDAQGMLTSLLTKAVHFRKDNRLLPAGFDKASRLPEGATIDWIVPVGTKGDLDFEAGRDRVRYRFPVPEGRVRITVEACFQSISPAEAARVAGLHREPEVIATTAIITDGR